MRMEKIFKMPKSSLLVKLARLAAPSFPQLNSHLVPQPLFLAASSVFPKLSNFLLSLAANACEQTRASRLKREEESLRRYCAHLCPTVPATVPTPPPLLCPTVPLLCPPHHPFSCPHVLRGQKTGRWVALLESPSGAGREANSLPYLRP